MLTAWASAAVPESTLHTVRGLLPFVTSVQATKTTLRNRIGFTQDVT